MAWRWPVSSPSASTQAPVASGASTVPEGSTSATRSISRSPWANISFMDRSCSAVRAARCSNQPDLDQVSSTKDKTIDSNRAKRNQVLSPFHLGSAHPGILAALWWAPGRDTVLEAYQRSSILVCFERCARRRQSLPFSLSNETELIDARSCPAPICDADKFSVICNWVHAGHAERRAPNERRRFDRHSTCNIRGNAPRKGHAPVTRS